MEVWAIFWAFIRRIPGHILSGVRGWLDFSGRTSREGFAVFWLLMWVFQTYVTSFGLSLTRGFSAIPHETWERLLLAFCALLFLWGNTALLALGVRRFRDAGLPPWAGILAFLPFANLVALPLALFRPSRDP